MSQTNSDSKIYTIGVAGVGCVGSAAVRFFAEDTPNKVVKYDKFKEGMNSEECFNQLLDCDFVFYCLPTLYSQDSLEYDKSAIYNVSERLDQKGYKGLVVVKSTVEPGTCEDLCKRYPNLHIVHNPEFLTARTAYEDFRNQPHVVLGKTARCDQNKFLELEKFYRTLWPEAKYSLNTSGHTECMKIMVNSFYAVKISVLNEFYGFCQKLGYDYNVVLEMMLKNGWINPMHTKIALDGRLGFGGMCFPKDLNSLNQCMERNGTFHAVINAACLQNTKIRGQWD